MSAHVDTIGDAPRDRPRPLARLPRSPSSGPETEDAWIDALADATGRVLEGEGLQLELLVFFDPATETLHAVGFDGAPARYFRGLEEVEESGRRERACPETTAAVVRSGTSVKESPGPERRGSLPMTALAGTEPRAPAPAPGSPPAEAPKGPP